MSEEKQQQTERDRSKPLKVRDPAQWKAKKLVRQQQKARSRSACRAAGGKLGRWRGTRATDKVKGGVWELGDTSPTKQKTGAV